MSWDSNRQSKAKEGKKNRSHDSEQVGIATHDSTTDKSKSDFFIFFFIDGGGARCSWWRRAATTASQLLRVSWR